jgi:Tol biopolymer transport system component
MNRPFKVAGIRTTEPPDQVPWAVSSNFGLPRWAPDGKRFLFQAFRRAGGTDEGPIQVFALFLVNADTGETRQITPELPFSEQVRDLCWLPEGKAITYLDRQRRFYTLSLNGGRTLWVDVTMPGHKGLGLGGYSPDGNWLLLSANADSIAASGDRDIWLMPHFGGRATPLVERPGMDSFPTWGPDGESVFFVSNGGHRLGQTWGLWKIRVDLKTGLPRGNSQPFFAKPGQKIHYPRFVAGGRGLVYAVEQPDTTILIGTSASLSCRPPAENRSWFMSWPSLKRRFRSGLPTANGSPTPSIKSCTALRVTEHCASLWPRFTGGMAGVCAGPPTARA